MYTILGYDKDNDVFVEYGEFEVLHYATEKAKELKKLLDKDELKRENGDPIDWVEIYWNYNGADEEIIWASYDN